MFDEFGKFIVMQMYDSNDETCIKSWQILMIRSIRGQFFYNGDFDFFYAVSETED